MLRRSGRGTNEKVTANEGVKVDEDRRRERERGRERWRHREREGEEERIKKDASGEDTRPPLFYPRPIRFIGPRSAESYDEFSLICFHPISEKRRPSPRHRPHFPPVPSFTGSGPLGADSPRDRGAITVNSCRQSRPGHRDGAETTCEDVASWKDRSRRRRRKPRRRLHGPSCLGINERGRFSGLPRHSEN